MRLDTEFYKLPFRFDPVRLAAEVLQFTEEEWEPHPQGHKGNSGLPLIAPLGKPSGDTVSGPMRPTKFLERMPYARQILAQFRTVLGRARLMRIAAEADATAHVDTNYYWMRHVRIHVPAVTFDSVRFLCNGKSVHMGAGECWIFDTWKMHNSINPNPKPRIHLVADTVGSEEFWTTVKHSERPFDPRPGALPVQHVPFDPHYQPVLRYENRNSPVVMSPQEQEEHLRELRADILMAGQAGGSEEQARALIARLERFQQEWKALYAQHGENPAGLPAYRAVLAGLEQDFPPKTRTLALPNGLDAASPIRAILIRAALHPELAEVYARAPGPYAEQIWPPADLNAPAESVPAEPAAAEPGAARKRFDRPVFVIAAPRSGSSLLFETLARSPGFYTVGGESHGLFESIHELMPQNRGFDSNVLRAEDATPVVIERLTSSLLGELRDRNGRKPQPGPLRLLEKTPKNALRIPFINAVFPDARFIYLYRDPRENIASIIEAWQAGRFRTYPKLPGWPGSDSGAANGALPWSLLLIPGWRELIGKPLPEIAARQWQVTHETALRDLEALPAERWCAVHYSDFLADPQRQAERLCNYVDVAWTEKLPRQLPLARHTLTPPSPDKWKRHAQVIEPLLPGLKGVIERAEGILSRFSGGRSEGELAQQAMQPPARERITVGARAAGAPPPAATPGAAGAPAAAGAAQEPRINGGPLKCVASTSLPELLTRLKCSFLVTTYQAGKLFIARALNGQLNTHFRDCPAPMGMAYDGRRLALGVKKQIWTYHNFPALGPKLTEPRPHDAVFMPRSVHVTGDVAIHEMAYSKNELWFVNTRFSCLCTADPSYSFVPRWRPSFVTALAPEDRCHLNGMALVDGEPRYVTALGMTDKAGGWRENKARGGVLMEVPSGKVLLEGLSMPHSPRLYDKRLWVLESGAGRLSAVDPQTGRLSAVCQVPGFTRGLDFFGPYAFVGLSQVRESAVFSGLAITEKYRPEERLCGVWVIDIRDGRTVGFLRFDAGVQEIFAVQVLPNCEFPEVLGGDEDFAASAYMLPDDALREVPQELRKT